MTDTALRPGPGPGDDPDSDDPSGRLAAYQARTQTPLDLLALATLWLCVVPPSDFSTAHHAQGVVLAIRGALSAVYGIDVAICSSMSRRPLRYLISHPVGVASVIFPPVRLILSIRLVRSMFRRGNLGRFLLAATVLALNGAVIVYLFERHAPHSTIHTLGESLWWSAETVTTVGYGDFVPVTAAGRITACFILATGLLTLAVGTAQVSSSFVSQGSRRARHAEAQAATPEVSLADLDRRLARIEQLLSTGSAASSQPTAGPPGREPGDGT